MFYMHISAFLDICAYLWPEMPGIAHQYIALEILRIIVMTMGIGLGMTIIGVVMHERIMK